MALTTEVMSSISYTVTVHVLDNKKTKNYFGKIILIYYNKQFY